MKKGWKIFWIVILTVVVMGFLFCGAALVMGFRISDFVEQYPNGIVLVKDDDHYDYSDRDDDIQDESLNSENGLEFENIKKLEISVRH